MYSAKLWHSQNTQKPAFTLLSFGAAEVVVSRVGHASVWMMYYRDLILYISFQASIQNDNGQWKRSKTMANVSFYLSIINWICTLSSALAILSSLMSMFLCYSDITDVVHIHCA